MKKPFYKKWQFWIIVVAVLALVGALGGGNDKPEAQKEEPAATSSSSTVESTTQTSVEPEILDMASPDNVKKVLKDNNIETTSVEFDEANKDLIITKQLEDNITNKSRITGAQTDTRAILETIKSNDMKPLDNVTVNETISLDDNTIVNAYIASFDKSYIETANLDDAIGDILTDNASSYYVHPDFK